MSGLPPDPPRLRAILGHLERQITESEAVGIYLRLQRDEVREALARASSVPSRERPAQRSGPQRRPPSSAEYMMETKLRPDDSLPVVVHVGGCKIRQGRRAPSAISAKQARMVLTDPAIGAEPCPVCRPESRLGLGVDLE
ncbi:DUF6233 domain-containing protein [Streptomyces sp. SUK 48]|uniref:DUF6233 domain-containing protein n=1 Tax=Streptomyces sp. SUK 48 TaxID=2582831 RepID=UPI00129BF523|nr:DUF6233 domain-containing protein [Streptomyces sp. SUK 48]